MGVTAGPADWWIASPEAINSLIISCPEATTLPDGSRIICKAGGKAWIVAPEFTQVGSTWGYSTTEDVPGTELCRVECWPTLCSRLISCGFNPSDWFVPCYQLLQNPGYVCRTNWDSFSVTAYWSSTEIGATNAYCVNYPNGGTGSRSKTYTHCVRAFRCVTY